jgi:hypothetical protein
MRIRLLDTVVTSFVVLAVAGCGGDEPTASTRTPAPTTTPVATVTATATAIATATASPAPTATVTATAAATATATPDTGGAEAGDEEGIRQPVDVSVSDSRISASVDHVAAFLPSRFTLTSGLSREVQVVVVRSGEGGGSAGRATLPAGGTATIDVDGLQPGSLEVLSPDLDPDMTAIVAVRGGG